MRISVLDLVPVRTGQSSAQAVAASLALVRVAEEAGATRYWFAEHHNMPAVASTTPPVLAAAAAAVTTRIRLGSGGVMLPNHAPFVIAEQFAALEAIAPGRIDLGLGRAPGSDPVITSLLRQSGIAGDVDRFPDHVTDILSLVRPGGASLRISSTGRLYPIAATPHAVSAPEVWLLGSSDYSARLAAQLGLPYVFANHFSGEGIDKALSIYRAEYRASDAHPEPETFLTVNAAVASTSAAARESALPQARSMARLRLSRGLQPAETIEEALAADADPVLDGRAEEIMARWIVEDAARAGARLRELAERHQVDEVMISPVAGAHAADPLDRVPGREATVRLLAAELLA